MDPFGDIFGDGAIAVSSTPTQTPKRKATSSTAPPASVGSSLFDEVDLGTPAPSRPQHGGAAVLDVPKLDFEDTLGSPTASGRGSTLPPPSPYTVRVAPKAQPVDDFEFPAPPPATATPTRAARTRGKPKRSHGHSSEHTCPTCHQSVDEDSLVDSDAGSDDDDSEHTSSDRKKGPSRTCASLQEDLAPTLSAAKETVSEWGSKAHQVGKERVWPAMERVGRKIRAKTSSLWKQGMLWWSGGNAAEAKGSDADENIDENEADLSGDENEPPPPTSYNAAPARRVGRRHSHYDEL